MFGGETLFNLDLDGLLIDSKLPLVSSFRVFEKLPNIPIAITIKTDIHYIRYKFTITNKIVYNAEIAIKMILFYFQ